MLRSFTNGLVTIGLLAGLLTGCGKQDALRSSQLPAPAPSNPSYPNNPDSGGSKPDDSASQPPVAPPVASTDAQILAQYTHFDPSRLINTKLLRAATLYFHKNKSKFANKKALTIIDFSLHSSKKRFFLMNVATGQVWSTYTSHGNGSDPGSYESATGYARTFSNSAGSNASSLGPYLTDATYSGKHGYSLRLKGLASTNSNAYSRAIVIHGASYVTDEARKQGRSQGCPALAMEYYEKVIDLVKGGSLIYADVSAKL